jgi:peptide/nickel transport system substrate-binding protein
VACGGGSDNGGSSSSAKPASGTSQAKLGGTLKVGYSGASITNFDPHTGASGAEHQFFFPVTEPIVGYDQKGNLDASISLAEKWELTEPTKLTLTLRSGIKFQDGADFTADDVKWNIERVIDPALASTPRSDLASIDSVQVVTKTQAVINSRSRAHRF